MKLMKALVKKEAKEGIWMEDVPIPEVDNNDVLIKLHKIYYSSFIQTLTVGFGI